MSENTNKDVKTLSELQQKALDVIISNLTESESELQNVSANMFLSDLKINSITFVKTIVALESAFDFEFEDEKLLFTAFPTIGSMIEYVESKVL